MRNCIRPSSQPNTHTLTIARKSYMPCKKGNNKKYFNSFVDNLLQFLKYANDGWIPFFLFQFGLLYSCYNRMSRNVVEGLVLTILLFVLALHLL